MLGGDRRANACDRLSTPSATKLPASQSKAWIIERTTIDCNRLRQRLQTRDNRQVSCDESRSSAINPIEPRARSQSRNLSERRTRCVNLQHSAIGWLVARAIELASGELEHTGRFLENFGKFAALAARQLLTQSRAANALSLSARRSTSPDWAQRRFTAQAVRNDFQHGLPRKSRLNPQLLRKTLNSPAKNGPSRPLTFLDSHQSPRRVERRGPAWAPRGQRYLA